MHSSRSTPGPRDAATLRVNRALVLTLALLVAPWAAASAATEKEIVAQLTAGLKDPDRDGLSAAIELAATVHNESKNAAARKKIQTALGKVLKSKNAGNDRVLAATALGKLDDVEGSYKQLSKALPTAKDKSASPAQLEVLRAVAALRPEKAVAPLCKFVEKSRAYPAVAEAAKALGGFGESKQRVVILRALLDTLNRYWSAAQAAAANPKGGSGDQAWKEAGESLIAALNALTGQSHADAPAWLAAAKEHKKSPEKLFPPAAK